MVHKLAIKLDVEMQGFSEKIWILRVNWRDACLPRIIS